MTNLSSKKLLSISFQGISFATYLHRHPPEMCSTSPARMLTSRNYIISIMCGDIWIQVDWRRVPHSKLYEATHIIIALGMFHSKKKIHSKTRSLILDLQIASFNLQPKKHSILILILIVVSCISWGEYLGPKDMRMGSGEGFTIRNFIFLTVHLI